MNVITLLNSQILDALSEHIAVLDKEGIIIYTNKAWDSFYDKNDEGITNKTSGLDDNYLDLIKKSIKEDPEKETFYNGILSVINREQDYYYADYPSHSQTNKKWYAMRVTPVGDNGEVVIAHANITDRVLMETKIKKSESRISKLFDTASEGILTIKDDGIITLVNDPLCKMFGYSKKELIGNSIEKLMLKKDRSSHHGQVNYFFSNSFSRKMGNGKLEINGLRKNGEEFPISISLNSFETETEKLAVAFVSDLTEINEAKTAIQEQANILVKTSEMAKIGSFQWLINENEVVWDDALHQIFETEEGFEPSFDAYMARVDKDRVEEVGASIYRALEEKSYFENSYKITTLKGNTKHLKTWGKVELNEQGDPIKMFGVCMDVTLQKEKEEDFFAEKKKFETLFSDTNIGMVMLDKSFHFINANKSFCEFIGYSLEELKKFTPLDITADDYINESKSILDSLAKNQKRDSRITKSYKRKDGEIVWGEEMNKQLKLPNGEILLYATIVDITERKKQEEKIVDINEKLNLVITGTKTGVWEWNLETNEVRFNEEWGLQLGLRFDEVIHDFSMWEKLVHPDDIEDATKRIEGYLSGKDKEYEFIHRMKHKNGEWKRILTKGVISKRAEDGTPLYFIGTHTDVNKEEQYLREISEYERYFAVSTDIMCIGDSEKYTKINQRFTDILGYTEGDVIGLKYAELIHPDDIGKTAEKLESLANGEKMIVFTNRYRCKNKEYKTLMWKAKPDLKTGLIYAAARDITDLVKEQEKSSQYFEILDNSLNEMYIICAKTFHILDTNIGAQKNLGYSADELKQMSPLDFNPELTAELFKGIVAPLVHKKEDVVTVETYHVRKDGSKYDIFLNIQLTKLGDKDVFVSMALDISDRIHQEVELKTTKNRLENIVDYANVGIAYANARTEVVSANQKFAEILEFDSGRDVLGMKVQDFTYPIDLDKDLGLLEEIKEGTRDAFEIEKRYVTKNDNIKWVDLNVSAVRNDDGEVINFIAMVVDINEKKQSEKDLLESEKKYKNVIKSFPDVILRVNSRGIIEMLSPSIEKVLGYKVEEVLNNKAKDYYVNQSDRDAYMSEIMENGYVDHFETQMYNKKGEVVDILAHGKLYKDSYGEYGFQSVLKDITEVKRAAKKIEDSEKRLKDVFDNVSDAIVVTNLDFEIKEYNNAFVNFCEEDIDYYGKIILDYIDDPERQDVYDDKYREILEQEGVNEFNGRVVINNGKIKWVDIKSTAIYDEKKKLIGVREVIRDVTERKLKDNIINVITTLSSTHGGEVYFNELTNSLSELLNLKYAIIGLYKPEVNQVETIGFSINGVIQENFSFGLENTPCRVTINGDVSIIPTRVQEQYPEDNCLVEMNAESYIGITLSNGKEPIGIIALLDEKPIENTEFITSVLQQVKTRTETEITRTNVENLIAEREARFRGMIENSSEITCLIDDKGIFKYVAPSITKILDYSVEELLGEKIYDYLHEEDRIKAFDRITFRYNDGSNGAYDVYRIIDKQGEYRYFRAILSNHFNTEGINGFIINAQDISELISAEKERYRIALHAEEKERKRLSQDLHDGLGQTIAAASLYMNTLDDLVEKQLDKETYEIFKAGKKLVNKSAKETRMVSHNIMPPSLTQFGLTESLSEMLSNYQKIKEDIDITFKSYIKSYRFSHEVELSLYRVVQELINNALKHSRAKGIEVTISIEADKCKISVKDDGVGFDYKLIKEDKKSGIGLRNIEQRVNVFGGDFDIISSENGTEFLITVSMHGIDFDDN